MKVLTSHWPTNMEGGQSCLHQLQGTCTFWCGAIGQGGISSRAEWAGQLGQAGEHPETQEDMLRSPAPGATWSFSPFYKDYAKLRKGKDKSHCHTVNGPQAPSQ